MQIRSLTLRDFRQYKGEHKITFPIDWGSDKNIVLIGGLNGAGKTTLLEATRLALFGKANNDLWSNTTYKAFLRQSLNRKAATEGVREFTLAVELETGDFRTAGALLIERHWRFKDEFESHSESLRLSVNGKERLGLTPEDAELLIEEYFPYGASQFVFFDGEKIQELAKDDNLGANTFQAIQDILGLRLHRQLEQDLWMYERSLLQKHADSEEYRKAEQDLERNRTQLAAIHERKLQLQADLQQAQEEHSSIQAERKRLGNQQLRDRWELDDTLITYRGEREELKKRLSSLVSQDLPMSLMQPQLNRLKEQLAIEARIEQDRAVASLLEEKRSKFFGSLVASGVSLQTVDVAWRQVFSVNDGDIPLLLRNLTVEQKYMLIHQIESIQSSAVEHLESLLSDLDMLEYKIRKVQLDRRAMPTDTAYLALEEREHQALDSIKDASEQLGATAVDERRLEHEKAVVDRSYEAARERVKLAAEVQVRVDKAQSLRNTVQIFIEQLAKEKAHEVQRYLNRMFHQLARKDALVQEFAIAPGSFAVTVTGTDGNPMELGSLSAGEKELFALSLLWSLGKAAVQELPMVIDTPLGRLDSVHRSHIAERFFPEANRQVIILTTDTEIDTELHELLKPYVAAEYRIDYVDEDQGTRVIPGYFFDEVSGHVD